MNNSNNKGWTHSYPNILCDKPQDIKNNMLYDFTGDKSKVKLPSIIIDRQEITKPKVLTLKPINKTNR